MTWKEFKENLMPAPIEKAEKLTWKEFKENLVPATIEKAEKLNPFWLYGATHGLMYNHHFSFLGPRPWDEIEKIITEEANDPCVDEDGENADHRDCMFDPGMRAIVETLIAFGAVTTVSASTENYSEFPLVGLKLDQNRFNFLSEIISNVDFSEYLFLCNDNIYDEQHYYLFAKNWKFMNKLASVLFTERDRFAAFEKMITHEELLGFWTAKHVLDSRDFPKQWPEILMEPINIFLKIPFYSYGWSSSWSKEREKLENEKGVKYQEAQIELITKIINLFQEKKIAFKGNNFDDVIQYETA